jgi:hypothetical protein
MKVILNWRSVIMSSNNKTSRREFLKKSVLSLGAIGLISKISSPKHAFAQTTVVDEASPTAAALGYKHDATLVDIVKFPKRAGDQGKKQLCSNCMFYSQGGQSVAGQSGLWGKCTLFPTALVAEEGWCNSWAIKPGSSL